MTKPGPERPSTPNFIIGFMAAGAGWPAAVLALCFSVERPLVFFPLTGLPALALYGLSLRPQLGGRWRTALGRALPALHLLVVLGCVVLVVAGYVTLTPGVVIPRVLAVLGGLAALWELVRSRTTASSPEREVARYLSGEIPVADLRPESLLALAVQAMELTESDAPRAEPIWRALRAVDALFPKATRQPSLAGTPGCWWTSSTRGRSHRADRTRHGGTDGRAGSRSIVAFHDGGQTRRGRPGCRSDHGLQHLL